MQGEIVSRTYLGAYTHYIIKVGDAELRSSKRNSVSDGVVYDVHQTVKIGFQEDSARVLGQ
jgi:hypothetical protein